MWAQLIKVIVKMTFEAVEAYQFVASLWGWG